MQNDIAAREREMDELKGAIAALDTLQQKLELRLNEARVRRWITSLPW
jgi:hypothetical protein